MRPYRAYTPGQGFLLPPALAGWLAEVDPVFFLRDVLEKLDLSAFHDVSPCRCSPPRLFRWHARNVAPIYNTITQ
jgi:hypothetical protein